MQDFGRWMLRTVKEWGSMFSQESERGAVLVTVALALIVLMGITALALDGGLAYNERRSTQNSADHAALAAAWAKCQGSTDATAQQAGRDSAIANGYDGAATNIDVTITKVTGTTGTYEAVVSSTSGTRFAGVIGQPSVTVLSRAIADCTRRIWGGGYALFANGPPACNAGFELDFSGGGVLIDGAVHSNGDLRFNGNNGNPSTITELATYVGDEAYTGVTFETGLESTSTQPDPFGITYASYLPANNVGRPNYYYEASGADIDQNWLVANGHATKSGGDTIFVRSGIFFTTGDIGNLSIQMGTDVSTGQLAKVTFVAGGQIGPISGKSNMTNYDPNGVLMFSNHQPPASCSSASNKAIQASASSFDWTGLIYAPNGEVQMSLSSGSSLNGSIFGHSVNLSGSGFEITYQDLGGGGPEFKVELVK